jgi:hypothetical protein
MVPLDFDFLAGCHPATSAAPAANAGWLTHGCRSGMGGLVSAGVRLSFYLKAQFSVRERGGHDSF